MVTTRKGVEPELVDRLDSGISPNRYIISAPEASPLVPSSDMVVVLWSRLIISRALIGGSGSKCQDEIRGYRRHRDCVGNSDQLKGIDW